MAGTTDPVVNTPDIVSNIIEDLATVTLTKGIEKDTSVVAEVVAELVDQVVEATDGAEQGAKADDENPREFGLLDSPFVSTSTISTLNSIQFEVDIAPHVNPPRLDDEEEHHQMQVLGFCAFMSKCIIGVVVLSCLLIAGCWYTK